MTMMRRLPATSTDVFRHFDRLFDDWMRAFPARMSFEAPAPRALEELIRVDEYLDQGTLVIKAQIPGIDPDQDLTITVADGLLGVRAERRVAEDTAEQGHTRHEMRYGMFGRRHAAAPRGRGRLVGERRLQGRHPHRPRAGAAGGDEAGPDAGRRREEMTTHAVAPEAANVTVRRVGEQTLIGAVDPEDMLVGAAGDLPTRPPTGGMRLHAARDSVE